LSDIYSISSDYLHHVKASILAFNEGRLPELTREYVSDNTGKPLVNVFEKEGYALVKVCGFMEIDPEPTQWLKGKSTSTKLLEDEIISLIKNDNVKAIIFDACSPGGSVGNIEKIGNLIYNNRENKKFILLVNNRAESSCFWSLSACQEIYMVDNMCKVGSIGAIGFHVDESNKLKNEGIIITEVVDGALKNALSANKPIDETGVKILSEQTRHTRSIFIKNVSRNRNIDEQKVVDMATGESFFTEKAIELGLVDGIKSLHDIVKTLGESTVMAVTRESLMRKIESGEALSEEERNELIAIMKTEAQSDNNETTAQNKDEETTAQNKEKEVAAMSQSTDLNTIREQERTRQAEIMAISQDPKHQKILNDACKFGWTVNDTKAVVFDFDKKTTSTPKEVKSPANYLDSLVAESQTVQTQVENSSKNTDNLHDTSPENCIKEAQQMVAMAKNYTESVWRQTGGTKPRN